MTKRRVLMLWLSLVACGQAPATGEAPRAAALVEPAPSLDVWKPGESYVYAVELDAKSELIGADAGAFTMSLRAELELVSSAEPVPTVLHALLLAPRVSVSGTAPVRGDELERELSQPFRAHLHSGRLTELELATGTSPQAVALLRTLLAALQAPPQLRSREIVEEHDATGRYEAEYAIHGPEVRKRKLRYLSLLAAGPVLGAKSIPSVVRTNGTLKPTQDGVWEQVLVEEQLETELPVGARVRSESVLQLVLMRRSPTTALSDEHRAWSGTLLLSANEPYVPTPARGAFDAQRIDGMTVRQALAQIRDETARANSDKPSTRREPASAEMMNAFSGLAALLRQDSAGIGETLAVARKNEQLASRLLDALASAGTPEAQRALIALVTDPHASDTLRRRAARSLIRVHAPIAEQVNLLGSMVDDPLLAEHGIYGLGKAARRLREAGEVARAETIVTTLGELMVQAKDDAERIRVLRGIANASDAALLERVRPMLDHASFGVREAAVHAVQRMKALEVDRLLARRLQADRHAAVRIAAATAIGLRDPAEHLAQALSQAALGDADAHVRHRAIRVMSHWLAERAELRRALEQVARSDREPKLREQATRALDGRPEPG